MSKTTTDFHRVCTLLDVPFDIAKSAPIAFRALLAKPGLMKVTTPNPEILYASLRVPGYRQVLQQADISLPDGHGLYWATSFLHRASGKNTLRVVGIFLKSYMQLITNRAALKSILPRLHHGSDTFFALHAAWDAKPSPRVFYFGGEDDVVQNIVPVMQHAYPHVDIVGNCGGYPFRSEQENAAILQSILQAKTEVLFIALPFPKQEQWLMQNAKALEEGGVRLAMVCGGTLDFAVGKRKRAPSWMRASGIEWLWRLYQEPSRLGRIWTAVVLFPMTLLWRRLRGCKDLTLA